MFVSVLYSQREQLAIITYISFVVFFIGSFLVYLAETQTNSQFKNIANSFWWAITIPGKFLASIFMIIGFWLFALPTEVIGTGVALRVEKMEADVIHSPQLIPAVILIQSYWRFYASNHKPLSQTTWYIPHNRVIVDRNQQNVVRFIRAVKLLTAKQAFKTMCRKTNKHMAHKNTHTEHRQFVNRIKLLQFEVKGVEERLVLTEDRMVEDLVTRIDRINELNRKISEKFMKQSQLLEHNGNGIKPKPRTTGLIRRSQTNIQDNKQLTIVVDNHIRHDLDTHINYFGIVLPKKDQRLSLYERIQHNTYEFLHQPSGLFSYTYHILVLILVLLCLIMTVMLSVQRFAITSWKIMEVLEPVILAWFVFEFVIRLWASGCRQAYQGWRGKVRYLLKIESIIDLVVIVVSAVVLGVQSLSSSADTSIVFAAAALRGFHRLFIVIRLVWARKSTSGVDSAVSPFRMFLSVLYLQREQLAIILYISFVVFFMASFLIYLAETQTNSQFATIANGMWWS
ncbi:unnamed protein product, partial [Oppiella nova]